MALSNKPISTRKPRKVKNAYVDISNVTIECGKNYCNWIPLTKSKLKVTYIYTVHLHIMYLSTFPVP